MTERRLRLSLIPLPERLGVCRVPGYRRVVARSPPMRDLWPHRVLQLSPSQHARITPHAGHPIVASFEPGEEWSFYRTEQLLSPCPWLPPYHDPLDRLTGPAGRVPFDWEDQLH